MSTEPLRHFCHWPGCEAECPPSHWGCPFHWYKLPISLKKAIRHTYRPGQEVDKRPSKEYIEVAAHVQEWCRAFVKRDRPKVKEYGVYPPRRISAAP